MLVLQLQLHKEQQMLQRDQFFCVTTKMIKQIKNGIEHTCSYVDMHKSSKVLEQLIGLNEEKGRRI